MNKCLSNREIAPGIYEMKIKWDQAGQAQCGQFVHILCEGAFLRRPISICDIENGDVLRIIFETKGKGTAALAKMQPGQEVDLLGPLGTGFTADKNFKNPLLIGGGIGVYPLYMLGRQLNDPQIFLGFRDKTRITLEQDFKQIGTLSITTDDGSYGKQGVVTTLVEQYLDQNQSDAIFACGPLPMLRAVHKIAMDRNIFCEISMEERMGCGIGACLVCACETEFGYKHVCKDGPVFNAKTLKL